MGEGRVFERTGWGGGRGGGGTLLGAAKKRPATAASPAHLGVTNLKRRFVRSAALARPSQTGHEADPPEATLNLAAHLAPGVSYARLCCPHRREHAGSESWAGRTRFRPSFRVPAVRPAPARRPWPRWTGAGGRARTTTRDIKMDRRASMQSSAIDEKASAPVSTFHTTHQTLFRPPSRHRSPSRRPTPPPPAAGPPARPAHTDPRPSVPPAPPPASPPPVRTPLCRRTCAGRHPRVPTRHLFSARSS